MKKLYIAIILVLFVPIFFIGFQVDAHAYAYIGRSITNGGVAYVDAWDHKGISLYLINAIGYGVFGFKSLIGIKILEFILILYAFLRFFNHLKRKETKLIAFIAGVFGLFTLKYFFDDGNLTEEYGTIFSLLSVLLLLKNKIRTIDYAIVGALFVINFTIRANLIGFWIALFFVYLVQLIIQQKTLKEVLLSFLKMGYGALAIVIALFGYLQLTGSFQEFLDAAFTFNFSYSSSTLSTTMKAVFASMTKYRLSFILILGWIFSLIRFYRDRSKFLELLLILWIPFELYLTNVSNRLYAHYFLMWVPLIMFSVSVILSELEQRFSISKLKLIIGSLLIFMAGYYVPSYMSLMHWKGVFSGKTQNDTIEYIQKNYGDDTILVWGNAVHIYNELDKISPITYFYHSTFKYNTDLVRDNIEDFTQQVVDKQPELIIDSSRSGLVSLDGSNASEVDKSQTENLKTFLDLIKTDYQLVEKKNGLTFYKLKTDE